jgi:hypothetical protein
MNHGNANHIVEKVAIHRKGQAIAYKAVEASLLTNPHQLATVITPELEANKIINY